MQLLWVLGYGIEEPDRCMCCVVNQMRHLKRLGSKSGVCTNRCTYQGRSCQLFILCSL